LFRGIEQRFDAAAQRAVITAGLVETGRAVFRRQLPRRSKDDFFWIRLVHGWIWNGLLPHKAKCGKKKAHGFQKEVWVQKNNNADHKPQAGTSSRTSNAGAPLISRLIVNEAPLFRADTKTETKGS
jgi:hypothetical protein